MTVLTLFLLACASATQTAPGTSKRPILSSTEATSFTKSTYLQGWSPSTISTSKADYTVGSNGYSTIQSAVNAAVNAGGTTRKYIKIPAGTYSQVVYIPSTNVPLTIYGGGSSASDTVISLSLSATITGSSYASKVKSLFSSGDPSYSIYESCASRSSLGTSCSSVFWVEASNVQIVNLSIENSSKNSGTDQAVALQLQGDKNQLENVRLLGHQDTFYVGTSSSTSRTIVTNTYIEGDIDFVFGTGSVVFDSSTFYVKGDRRTDEAVIFAPDTPAAHEYGFLVIDSTIEGASNWATSKAVYLARSWDSNVSSASAYVAGTSPNGQLVIRESSISGIVNTSAPYTTATSGRAYSGNGSSSRNLNNQNYNRFWEYANTGSGA